MFRLFLDFRLGHPDNTDIIACPLVVRINRVQLFLSSSESLQANYKYLCLLSGSKDASSACSYCC